MCMCVISPDSPSSLPLAQVAAALFSMHKVRLNWINADWKVAKKENGVTGRERRLVSVADVAWSGVLKNYLYFFCHYCQFDDDWKCNLNNITLLGSLRYASVLGLNDLLWFWSKSEFETRRSHDRQNLRYQLSHTWNPVPLFSHQAYNQPACVSWQAMRTNQRRAAPLKMLTRYANALRVISSYL